MPHVSARRPIGSDRPRTLPSPRAPELPRLQQLIGNRAMGAALQRFTDKQGKVVAKPADLDAMGLDQLIKLFNDVRSRKVVPAEGLPAPAAAPTDVADDPRAHADELPQLHRRLVLAALDQALLNPLAQKEAVDTVQRLGETLLAGGALDESQTVELGKALVRVKGIKPPADAAPAPAPAAGSVLDLAGEGVAHKAETAVKVVKALQPDWNHSMVRSVIASYSTGDKDEAGRSIARTDWVLEDRYVSNWDKPSGVQHGLGDGWGFSSAHAIPSGKWVIHVHRSDDGKIKTGNVQEAKLEGMGATKDSLTPTQLKRIGIPEVVEPSAHVLKKWAQAGKPKS